MKKNESDIAKLQMNAGEANNSELNSELIKRTEIMDTPFTIIEIEDTKEIFLTIGKYRLSEKFNTFDEALNEGNTINWDKIMQIIAIMIENYGPLNQ